MHLPVIFALDSISGTLPPPFLTMATSSNSPRWKREKLCSGLNCLKPVSRLTKSTLCSACKAICSYNCHWACCNNRWHSCWKLRQQCWCISPPCTDRQTKSYCSIHGPKYIQQGVTINSTSFSAACVFFTDLHFKSYYCHQYCYKIDGGKGIISPDFNPTNVVTIIEQANLPIITEETLLRLKANDSRLRFEIEVKRDCILFTVKGGSAVVEKELYIIMILLDLIEFRGGLCEEQTNIRTYKSTLKSQKKKVSVVLFHVCHFLPPWLTFLLSPSTGTGKACMIEYKK